MKIGTVICTPNGPNTNNFQFVVEGDVKKGQFVGVKNKNEIFIAMVSDIERANRYFEHAESVAEYERAEGMRQHFPITEWEYTVAQTRVLGVYNMDTNLSKRCVFPVAPGDEVVEVSNDVLKSFLQLSDSGLHLGTIQQHSLDAKFKLSRLIQKHLAILAMSGSGKSYLTGDLIEEILDIPKERGRIAVVVIDVHGEYLGFKSDPKYGKQTVVFPADKIRVKLAGLSSYDFSGLGIDLSAVQKRELDHILKYMKKNAVGDAYGLEELIIRIQQSDIKENIKIPLISWMKRLKSLSIVAKHNEPTLDKLVKPGQLSIIDLSEEIRRDKKLLIVSQIARRIFNARKEKGGRIPPTLLIVEEAHNFAGQGEASESIARSILETIAREGRKFGVALCVITQRPVRLSTTVLSQCNTHIILRVTNPNDIQHIVDSCEGIDSYMAKSITTLQVGEALVVGEATRFPFFMKVRKRKTKLSSKEKPMEESAIEFEKRMEEKEQQIKEMESDIDAFI